MSLVSVIIPTFNRLEWLKKAVASVCAQTFRDWRLLIVDDGSNDGTESWVMELSQSHPKQIELIRNSTNLGVSAARNLGIRHAESPWIAFLDSDDQWLPRKLERQLEFAKGSGLKTVLIHCDEIWQSSRGIVKQHSKHKKGGGRQFARVAEICCISPSAALIPAGTLQETGLFREDFPVCEDYELWLRICALGDIGFVDEPLVIKNGGHPDQLSRRYHSMDYWRVLALKPFLSSGYISFSERQIVRHELQRRIDILQKGYEKRGKSLPPEIEGILKSLGEMQNNPSP